MSEDFLTITNSVDPDEVQNYAAFRLGLHCMRKFSFRAFPNTWVNYDSPIETKKKNTRTQKI